MCRQLLDIFKEDDTKVFLSVISESVHKDCELVSPEDVYFTSVKSRYALGALCRRETIDREMAISLDNN